MLGPVLLGLLLTGCDQNSLVRVAGLAGWEYAWGQPSAEALARSKSFEGAGLSFDYPAPLRRRENVDDDGDREWNFEYGMFELEVRALTIPMRSDSYLSVMGDMLSGGRRIDAKGPYVGRTETLCGHAITSTTLRVKMMDDWSELEVFDLPAPDGESRMLIFDDEPVKGQPSAVARATRERVLSSLRCDATFVLRSDDPD